MRRPAGFSLLEVLVAVTLLALGLLALAALQGALARSASDANARARVVALLAGELDTLRATPFAEIASLATPIDASNADCGTPENAAEHAACDAGIRGLRVQRIVTHLGAALHWVQVSAEWNAATGETRTLELRTLLGELALDPNRLHAVKPAPMHAQVHQAIPDLPSIGVGEGSVATTIPAPIFQRGEEVGTRFDVLRFEEDGEQARLDARTEMQFVKCRCQYGAGGVSLGPLHAVARWPAIWSGHRYAPYVPEDRSAAAGNRYASGPMPDIVQSPQCRECCRDRHDNAGASPHPKFDPFARDDRYRKYDLDADDALIEATDTARGTYVDSCRLVRVDGWWRTAADVQARQFGLLQTASVGGVPATSPQPDVDAMARYTQFVHDALAQPDDAQALHDAPARGLNAPARITMRAPPATDLRHLHARALYIDALEPAALAVIAAACPPGSDADCVRPLLPFFTLDLTDLATWSATDPAVLEVARGRVRALAAGASDALVDTRTSNSGIARGAGVPGPTDLQGDETTLADAQSFEITGSGPARIDAAPRGQPKYATPPE